MFGIDLIENVKDIEFGDGDVGIVTQVLVDNKGNKYPAIRLYAVDKREVGTKLKLKDVHNKKPVINLIFKKKESYNAFLEAMDKVGDILIDENL